MIQAQFRSSITANQIPFANAHNEEVSERTDCFLTVKWKYPELCIVVVVIDR